MNPQTSLIAGSLPGLNAAIDVEGVIGSEPSDDGRSALIKRTTRMKPANQCIELLAYFIDSTVGAVNKHVTKNVQR